ncbi:hypothetical protein [Brevibacillus sp. SIMBA_040]|uniref:hypothetical protein n=1 Tax=unclassified Brevibacillus TaxID=2684853 RepID=UPI00397C3E44
MIKKLKVVATVLSTASALLASVTAVYAAEKYSLTQVGKNYAIRAPEKPDQRYPFPEGWTPNQIMATWTSDKQKNMQILADELEFVNLGAGAAYSPYGKGPGTTSILVSADATENYDTLITISVWKGSNYLPLDNKIPYIMKELFRFYFPNEGSKLWQIADDAFNNKNVDKYLNKTLTYDDRQVKMMNVQGNLVIVVGKPGTKYDSEWNVIR